MTVVTYTLHECVKCMNCLQKCPVEAIHIRNERVHIVKNKCINCGKCIEACRHAGLTAKGSTLVDLQHYKKKVCLIPSAIYADCVSEQEARKLNAAILKLGFDEIVSLASYEGAVYEHVNDVIDNQKCLISSFCPVINQLIATRYPMLLDNQVQFDYPAVIAAKQIRKENKEAGIFLLCECPSKLALGKYPYGNTKSEIDHCLSIVDVFPQINANRSLDEVPVHLTTSGIKSAATGLGQRFDAQILSVNGIDKVKKALELAEFGLLKEVRYLSLSACFNGCIGGQFLWGNPFNGRINMHELLKVAEKEDKYSVKRNHERKS